jgi:hypothetical protein
MDHDCALFSSYSGVDAATEAEESSISLRLKNETQFEARKKRIHQICLRLLKTISSFIVLNLDATT